MRLVSKCFQRGASKPQVDEEIEELEKQIQAVLLRDSQIEDDLIRDFESFNKFVKKVQYTNLQVVSDNPGKAVSSDGLCH
jgi:hypothetical protein